DAGGASDLATEAGRDVDREQLAVAGHAVERRAEGCEPPDAAEVRHPDDARPGAVERHFHQPVAAGGASRHRGVEAAVEEREIAARGETAGEGRDPRRGAPRRVEEI